MISVLCFLMIGAVPYEYEARASLALAAAMRQQEPRKVVIQPSPASPPVILYSPAPAAGYLRGCPT